MLVYEDYIRAFSSMKTTRAFLPHTCLFFYEGYTHVFSSIKTTHLNDAGL